MTNSSIEQTHTEFPGGPLPLNSPLYIERPPIEQRAREEICKPGSVIRIKAPKQMGKSSLLLRLLDRAEQLDYRTVSLDFLQADETIFSSLDRLLRWFCANISRQLKLEPMLDAYWDEDIGSKVSCTIYLQGYLLEQIHSPIVLSLNEINRLFEHPHLAREFLALLRSWYEEARQQNSFQKLRMILVHSTEVYIDFNINQSPFNIGLPIRLSELTLEQVIRLAGAYGLDWTEGTEAQKLMAVVGGQPYLVSAALYHIVTCSTSLDEILENAHEVAGIYSNYLRKHLVSLQKHPELATALQEVILAEGEAKLAPILAYKLEQMGLVKLKSNSIALSCNLYRNFFATYNFGGSNLTAKIEELQKEIQRLNQICQLDETTQLLKRSSLESAIEDLLPKLESESSPISLLLCEIDFFKLYTERKRQTLSEKALRQIAGAISKSLLQKDELAARYSWTQFAIALPRLNEERTFKVAETIHSEVSKLAIPYELNSMGGFPSPVMTVSLGFTSLIPNKETSLEGLMAAAFEALYQARIKGGNRTESTSTLAD